MGEVLVLALFVLSSAAGIVPARTATPKNYTVNLDVAPEKRWQEIVLEYKHHIEPVYQMIE